MNFPQFDKRYWIFLTVITWAHLFAVISTYHAITNLGAAEGNPLVSWLFNSLGITASLILLNIIGIVLMLALPVIMGEHDKFKLNTSTATYSGLFILITLDSVHDLFALLGHPAANTTYAIFSVFFTYSPYLMVAGLIVISMYYLVRIGNKKISQVKL